MTSPPPGCGNCMKPSVGDCACPGTPNASRQRPIANRMERRMKLPLNLMRPVESPSMPRRLSAARSRASASTPVCTSICERAPFACDSMALLPGNASAAAASAGFPGAVAVGAACARPRCHGIGLSRLHARVLAAAGAGRTGALDTVAGRVHRLIHGFAPLRTGCGRGVSVRRILRMGRSGNLNETAHFRDRRSNAWPAYTVGMPASE